MPSSQSFIPEQHRPSIVAENNAYGRLIVSAALNVGSGAAAVVAKYETSSEIGLLAGALFVGGVMSGIQTIRHARKAGELRSDR